MKKLIFILMFLAINAFCYSQTFSSQTGTNMSKTISSGRIAHELLRKSDNGYYISIISTNEFEDKVVIINVGDNITNATTNLKDLLKCYEVWDRKKYYNLDGNRCSLYNNLTIWFYPEYAAGDYFLSKSSVKKFINAIE